MFPSGRGRTCVEVARRGEVGPEQNAAGLSGLSEAIQLDTFCHWGFGLKFRVTGGARWPGFMLLSVIDAVIVT